MLGISLGETTKRPTLALRHLMSLFLTTNNKSSHIRIDLFWLLSSYLTSKFLFGTVLKICELTPDKEPNSSSCRVSSSRTLRLIVMTMVSRVFFLFFLEVTEVAQGFLSMTSCIRRAPRKLIEMTISLPKLFWHFTFRWIVDVTTSSAIINGLDRRILHTPSHGIAKKHVSTVLSFLSFQT